MVKEYKEDKDNTDDNTVLALHSVGKLLYRLVILITLLSLFYKAFGNSGGLVILAFMTFFALTFLTLSEITNDIETLEDKQNATPTEKEIILKERNEELAIKLMELQQEKENHNWR